MITLLGYTKNLMDHEKATIDQIVNKFSYDDRVKDIPLKIVINIDYSHEPTDQLENDEGWKGQFDCILIGRNHLVIYELKNKVAFVEAYTDGRDYKVRYIDSNIYRTEKSYFLQISKQRAFLLQDYLSGMKERGEISKENHFAVDARLVLPDGADINIHHRVPLDFYFEEFNKLISKLNQEDADIINKNYRVVEGKYKLIDGQKDYFNLNRIFDDHPEFKRTMKWFKVIMISQIIDDFLTCGSKRFNLTEDEIMKICYGLLK